MTASLCRRAVGTLAALLLIAVSMHGTARAQTYPTRPIRVVVPFAPGGGTDILARLIAPKLSDDLGQQIVIDNRPGAGGNIGADLVAKAAPDGYTLVMVDTSYAVNPSLFAKLPFDPAKDLTPVTLLASGPVILIAHPSVPARTVEALVALARAKPGQLNFASGGNGSSTHLAGELFKSVAGIDIVHIPYKGTGLAINDLVAGQVALMFAGISQARAHADAGKVIALAVTGDARAPAMPQVPTFTEAGLAGVDSSTYWGVLAPAATPPALVARVSAAFAKAVRAPDLQARLGDLGYQSIGSTREGYADNLRTETAKWAAVVKRAGVTLE